jgi:hypothetical protein
VPDVFGWKGDALQRAMDDNGCFSATCGNQKSQDISVAKQCKIPKTVKEDVDGCKWLCWRVVLIVCADPFIGMTQLPGSPMMS